MGKPLITVFLLVTSTLLWSCSQATPVATSPETTASASVSAPTLHASFPSSTPEVRFQSDGGGEPRTPGYWLVWNTCAPENRAGIAAANGGREAGWTLMDDLIADPGIQLGDYLVANCEEGLALLQVRTVAGEDSSDPVYKLASALLAAELNLNAGAEICPIAEEAVRGGHLVLADTGFDGPGANTLDMSGEIASAIPRLIELLEGYNRGELCR